MRDRLVAAIVLVIAFATCAHRPPAEKREAGQCPDFTGRYLFDPAACTARHPEDYGIEVDLFPDGSPFPRTTTLVTMEQRDCDQVDVVVHGDRRVSSFYIGGEDAWWRGAELYTEQKTSGFAQVPVAHATDRTWWSIAPAPDGGVVFTSGFSEWSRFLFIFPIYSGRKMSCNLRPHT